MASTANLVVWLLCFLCVEAQLNGVSAAQPNSTVTEVNLIQSQLDEALRRLDSLKQQRAQLEHESVGTNVDQQPEAQHVSEVASKAFEEVSQHNVQLEKREFRSQDQILRSNFQSLVQENVSKNPAKIVRVILRWVLLVSIRFVVLKGFLDDPYRCPSEFPDILSSIVIDLAGAADIAHELTSESDPSIAHVPGTLLNLAAVMIPLWRVTQPEPVEFPHGKHTQRQPSGTGTIFLVLGAAMGLIALVMGFATKAVGTTRQLIFIATFFVSVMPLHEVVTTRTADCAARMMGLGEAIYNWKGLVGFFLLFLAVGQGFDKIHTAGTLM